MKISNYSKTFIIISVAVIIAELLIRLVSYVTVLQRSCFVKTEKDQRKIYCYGDSFTFGIGVIPSQSYPAQLQKLCDNRLKDKNIAIINRGFPGANSSTILKHIKQEVSLEKPECIIFLGGCDNFYNFQDMDFSSRDINLKLSHLLKVDSFLSYSRIYKIVKYGILSTFNSKFKEGYLLKNKISTKKAVLSLTRDSKNKYLETRKLIGKFKKGTIDRKEYQILASIYSIKGRYKVAEVIYKRGLSVFQNEPDLLLNFGQYYESIYLYNYAIKQYERILELEPTNRNAYHCLASSYRATGEYQKALEATNKLLEIDSKNRAVFYKKGWIYMDLKEHDKALQNFKNANEAIPNELKELKALDVLLVEILHRDLIELIRLTNLSDIRLVFVKYPDIPLDNIIDNVSKNYNIPLVDLSLKFSKILEREKRPDYFWPDGHCNKRGYAIIAEAAFDIIKKYDIL